LHDTQPAIGAVARLVNVVVDPTAAFRDLRAAHPWALAVVATIVLRIVSLLVFYDPELKPLKILASLAFQVGAVVPPLLVGTTAIWLLAMAWRLRIVWAQLFSICAHVTVAYTLATIACASVAGALLPDSTSIDIRNPPYTNLGFLYHGTGTVTLFHRLASEADIRSAYAAALLWLGLRVAGEAEPPPRKAGVVAAYVVASLVIVRLVRVVAVAIATG
jgi:hypothetical protein